MLQIFDLIIRIQCGICPYPCITYQSNLYPYDLDLYLLLCRSSQTYCYVDIIDKHSHECNMSILPHAYQFLGYSPKEIPSKFMLKISPFGIDGNIDEKPSKFQEYQIVFYCCCWLASIVHTLKSLNTTRAYSCFFDKNCLLRTKQFPIHQVHIPTSLYESF